MFIWGHKCIIKRQASLMNCKERRWCFCMLHYGVRCYQSCVRKLWRLWLKVYHYYDLFIRKGRGFGQQSFKQLHSRGAAEIVDLRYGLPHSTCCLNVIWLFAFSRHLFFDVEMTPSGNYRVVINYPYQNITCLGILHFV